VTGVDLSDKMLGIARARALREGVSVEWLREDMRVFRRPGAFDLCLSLFTSFGFFNDRENQRVLDNVGVNLKEGGILLLDLRNAGKGLSRLEDWDRRSRSLREHFGCRSGSIAAPCVRRRSTC